MKHEPITIIMTSCDRFDLLIKTMDSFFALNKYPYVAFHIHNDSIEPVPIEVKNLYENKKITWHEGVKRGLSGSWDYLIEHVNTEYFFNLEDDWLFYGNADFIAESMVLMEIYGSDQVWIRNHADHNQPTEYYLPIAHKIIKTKDWCGFTFNPSLRNKNKWNRWFPDGIAGMDEIDISRKLMHIYNACTLSDSTIKHIGGGRHTHDFII